jgi:hypothetical protein
MDKYKCDKCLKFFLTKRTLKTHMDKYHCLKIDIQNNNSKYLW